MQPPFPEVQAQGLYSSLCNVISCPPVSHHGKRRKAISDRQFGLRVWLNHLSQILKAQATFSPRNWQHTVSDVPDY